MQHLDPETLQLEIASFNMDLKRAFQKDGPIYVTMHRDVAQGMINLEVDLKGTLMALEDRIKGLELELES